MAIHWPTLRTRALTAVVFVAVMAAGLLYNHWSFWALMVVVFLGCWYEFLALVNKIWPGSHWGNPFVFLGLALGGVMTLFDVAHLPYDRERVNLVKILNGLEKAPLGLVAIGVVAAVWKKPTADILRKAWVVPTGFFYAVGAGCALLSLYLLGQQIWPAQQPFLLPCLVIATVWVNDTMAYLVGSLLGKTPLSPISPKKTWEGTLGGLALAVLVVSLGAHALWALDMDLLFALSFSAAVAGIFGDLLESKIKRLAGVKDSGHFMPGHGGFLDRFDALLLAAPTVWAVLYLFF